MSAQTRNNIYGTLLKRIFSLRIFSVAWKVVSYWPTLLSAAKRHEYGLYKVDEQPPVAVMSERELAPVA